jgi:hypothetical protein
LFEQNPHPAACACSLLLLLLLLLLLARNDVSHELGDGSIGGVR